MPAAVHEPSAAQRVRRFALRRERTLIVVWIAGCAVALGAFAIWGVALGGAERAVEAWDARWVAKVDRGVGLVERGRYDEAIAYLEALDAEFPARFVKHRLDRERERLLTSLARAYVELDRRRAARDTLERLVDFDPKNFGNHVALAQAEQRFGDGAAARESYLAALAIQPSHLPSVQALIEMSADGGRYAEVVADYQRYLDAYLLARIALRAGGRAIELEVPVDGREHVVEAPLELPAVWRGPLCLETRGYSARLVSIAVEPPLHVGEVVRRLPLPISDGLAWTATGGSSPSNGEIAASGASSMLCAEVVDIASGAARVRVRIALFKALPADIWAAVEKSGSNELALDFLREARERSRVGGCLEAGSVAAD